jgi:exocyst complex component 3
VAALHQVPCSCHWPDPISDNQIRFPDHGVAKMSAAAPISAAQAIGEYLQSPDDLLKIAAFRKKLEKEKASIDARLKSGVKEQLDATREGLRKLLSTRNNVQVIKDEMQTIDRACSDPHNVVPTFDQISRVSMLSPYIHN